MSYTQRYSEWFNPLLAEHTDSIPVGIYASAWASLQNYHRARLVLNVGTMQIGSWLTVVLYQAQDAAGTGAKLIGSKAGLTKSISLLQTNGDSDTLTCIELQTEEMDVEGGFEHVGIVTTVLGGAVIHGWELSAYEPRYAPVPATNWDEIVD